MSRFRAGLRIIVAGAARSTGGRRIRPPVASGLPQGPHRAASPPFARTLPGGLPLWQRHRLLDVRGPGFATRCPRCGEGMLFRGWFRMRSQCDWCGLVYEREPGFFLGLGLHQLRPDRRVDDDHLLRALLAGAWLRPTRCSGSLAAFCLLFPFLVLPLCPQSVAGLRPVLGPDAG